MRSFLDAMGLKITLRRRIQILVAALVLISMAGGVVIIWYTYRIEGLLTRMIDRDVAAFQTAEALETALINQKGFVSYYFLDRDPHWLKELEKYRQVFRRELSEARHFAGSHTEKQAVNQIESSYNDYITAKDKVIALYKAGRLEEGAALHKGVRDDFFKIVLLCRKYKGLYTRKIEETRNYTQRQADRLRLIAFTGMAIAFGLGLLLATVLIYQVLGPLGRLAKEASPGGESIQSSNEVQSLSRSVRGLLEDYDYAHTELEKSRESLIQAEKLALAGKLAAGVSHSIRNPLASVNMRLFSLNRTLKFEKSQQEDFQVIVEEIRHIDTIVQNFLEFSRRPRLRIQQVSPSEIVAATLQLLEHRLKAYNVELHIERPSGPLPEVEADPEQLKEVLVNLIINACEAMEGGGTITIREEIERKGKDSVARIRVMDTGPGIPRVLQGKVMQPFFTTKDEGTGLGLSIAVRILEEHGGSLELDSEEGRGAAFTITLPLDKSTYE